MTTTVARQPPSGEQLPAGQRPSAAFDLLALPAVGRLLRWRHSRLMLQLPLLAVSVVMVAHAFWGPDLAPKNLAALLTWVHFRGLVVLALLCAGNLFCMACPFLLPRELARRLITPRWEWPRWLRGKWLSLALFVAVLFTYELFDLWSDPWWTGVLIVAYFAAALLVDSLFRRASFCKHVCPVGQFNFFGSTLSPLEVAVRDHLVCHTCTTKDCILGRRTEAPQTLDRQRPAGQPLLPIIQRGCELGLFQPRKVGNLDCTFCLDCVYACPHDNVGLLARLPAEELVAEGSRSGLGVVQRRADLSAWMIVFTFAALLNAFAMISPVYALEQAIAEWTGLTVEWPILATLFAVTLLVEPAALLAAAAFATRWLSRTDESLLAIVQRFARSLVPIGFGIWLAHYGFHFFTGLLTVIPVTQHAVWRTTGRELLGAPQWQWGGMPESIVFPLEMGFLGLGLLGSWLVAWGISRQLAAERTLGGWAPWAGLHLAIFAAAVWIMTQPMDMRGTFLGG